MLFDQNQKIDLPNVHTKFRNFIPNANLEGGRGLNLGTFNSTFEWEDINTSLPYTGPLSVTIGH